MTCEYTTLDGRGRPITWPVTPYYRQGGETIDVTTGLGYPKKANDARVNSKVSLLFSHPRGSGLDNAPMVLVQGIADVDDRDLDLNRDRYYRESTRKLPAIRRMLPPRPVQGMFKWYFARIYIHVRPERVYVWPDADPASEPKLLGTHMDEVRSGHTDEPLAGHAAPEGGPAAWDARMDELGSRYPTAVLTTVVPDGFPFSLRLPIDLNREERTVSIDGEPAAAVLEPGPACLTAHDHGDEFQWQQNFQVRGDLVRQAGTWKLIPHRLVGGFELPPVSLLKKHMANFRKMRKFHKTARSELRKRKGH